MKQPIKGWYKNGCGCCRWRLDNVCRMYGTMKCRSGVLCVFMLLGITELCFGMGRASPFPPRPRTFMAPKPPPPRQGVSKPASTRSDGVMGDGRSMALGLVNVLRQRHGAPALVRDPSVEEFAQGWAKQLADTGAWVHSRSRYGENLANVSWSGNETRALETAVNLWYAEIGSYNYSNPGFSLDTGHFTALVWRNTMSVGMGVGVSPDGRRAIICFSFWPPGNMRGAFGENVWPTVSSVIDRE